MTNINLEIPDELHKELKIGASKEGKTLKQKIIDILTDLENE